ncbi:MAG: hypothetical protein CMH62_03825 [Nanoarchaeota archaeon]|nr:hypothetical protein [Nanoarchaeota archaeon]
MAECSILNLASCLPEKFFEFIKGIINAPFAPLLDLVQKLLSEPVNIEIFQSLWVLIVYILSIFYGLLMLWAGFNFITSSYDVSKREYAKAWLKDVIIMIVLVQASYFFYQATLEISASLTSGVLSLIDPDFFLLTASSLSSLGLELAFGIVYLSVLILTVTLLAIRYFLVAVGLVIFPIGIFFNFIPFLKQYGKLIINSLMVIVFLPFFQGLILLIISKMLEVTTFDNYKILVMITAFLLINLLMIFLLIFSIVKSALAVMSSDVGKVATVVAGKVPTPSPKNPQTKLGDFTR